MTQRTRPYAPQNTRNPRNPRKRKTCVQTPKGDQEIRRFFRRSGCDRPKSGKGRSLFDWLRVRVTDPAHPRRRAPAVQTTLARRQVSRLLPRSSQEQDDREHCPDSSPNTNLVNPDLDVSIFVGHLMNAAEGLTPCSAAPGRGGWLKRRTSPASAATHS